MMIVSSRPLPVHPLPLRNHTTQEMFGAAWANIERVIDVHAVESRATRTLNHMFHTLHTISRSVADRYALAWSGGKDSLVVHHLLLRAQQLVQGLGTYVGGVYGVTDGLEYPAMQQWCKAHQPPEVTTWVRHIDLAYLAAHPQMLFPRTGALQNRWMDMVWRTAQHLYAKQHGVTLMLYGRRLADENYCGPQGLYPSKGHWRYNPIWDWSHEEVLGYLHYHNIPLPPIYGWHNGYAEGTHPWPMRCETLDEEDGWAQVYSIDPGVVHRAATLLPGAARYLANPTPIKTSGPHWYWTGSQKRPPRSTQKKRVRVIGEAEVAL